MQQSDRLLELQVHDKRGYVDSSEGCAVGYLGDQVAVVGMLTDPNTGVELRPDEVFGQEMELQAPETKGTYGIESRFVLVGFMDSQKCQKSALAVRIMRV